MCMQSAFCFGATEGVSHPQEQIECDGPIPLRVRLLVLYIQIRRSPARCVSESALNIGAPTLDLLSRICHTFPTVSVCLDKIKIIMFSPSINFLFLKKSIISEYFREWVFLNPKRLFQYPIPIQIRQPFITFSANITE